MTRVSLLALGLLVALAFAAGLAQETRRKSAEKSKAGEQIDFDRARTLKAKQQKGEKLTADEDAYLKKAIAVRNAQGGGNQGKQGRAVFNKETTGLKPLTEMSATDNYLGQDGGLYGGGKNTPPDE